MSRGRAGCSLLLRRPTVSEQSSGEWATRSRFRSERRDLSTRSSSIGSMGRCGADRRTMVRTTASPGDEKLSRQYDGQEEEEGLEEEEDSGSDVVNKRKNKEITSINKVTFKLNKGIHKSLVTN